MNIHREADSHGRALIVGLAIVSSLAANVPSADLSSDRFMRHVAFLASDDMKGRGNGTPEIDRAAEYIAAEFESYGLEPFGADHSFFQPFPLTIAALPGTTNALSLDGSPLRPHDDFVMLPASSSGFFEGGLVFAGYGITAPELNWDDYAAIDATGKAVVVLSHHPWERLPSTRAPAAVTSFEMKVRNARRHGARAILFVLDPNNHRHDDVTSLDTSYVVPYDLGIPAAYVSRRALAPLFERAGTSLAGAQLRIDAARRPESFALNGSTMHIVGDLRRLGTTGRNVLAALPGADPAAKNEWLIIGAHYDHLGLGDPHRPWSLATGQTHYGADDNASGTAGLLELARVLGRNRHALKRSILFAAFAGEEMGLMGSSHLVDSLPVPLTSVTAMLNLDMIGRLSGLPLNIMGMRIPDAVADWIRRENDSVHLSLAFSDGDTDSGDWAVFQAMGIPALTFHTGMHDDYHRPSDVAGKIDVRGAMRILRLIGGTTRRIAGAESSVRRSPFPRLNLALTEIEPYFGVPPVLSPSRDVMQLDEVRPGTPAARAGLQSGDIVVEFGESSMKTPADFSAALQSFRPGDMVAIRIRRRDRLMRVAVTLEPPLGSAVDAERTDAASDGP